MSERSMLTEYSEGTTRFSILGYVTWWNVRNVDVGLHDLEQWLRESGLQPGFVREHNYRSAVIRAFRNMEQKRIIRKVLEDKDQLVYQFTAEIITGTGDEAALDYVRETKVVISKEVFRTGSDFGACVTRCDPAIKEALVAHYAREKLRFRSGDVTRLIQRILKSEADIVQMREQGCVYFVPATFRHVLDRIRDLTDRIGTGCTLSTLPLPHVQQSKDAVKEALTREAEQSFASLAAEIDRVLSGDLQRGERWETNLHNRIQSIKQRIGAYAEVLNGGAEELAGRFQGLLEGVGKRKLDLE